MLLMYYVMLFSILRENTKQNTQQVFQILKYDLSNSNVVTNENINKVLKKPLFQDISYQLVLMVRSGQTYVYSHTRPSEPKFTTINFPALFRQNSDAVSTYEMTNQSLMGTLNFQNGQRLHIILRHQPLNINWLSYQYWLPPMVAVILFIIALLYMLKHRANWDQLLHYTEDIMADVKDAYIPPPFEEAESTLEFLRLGHALSRIGYQLHNQHRHIKRLNHRLERLVDQAPLPMLMIMRQGQISFSNQRFDQIFSPSLERDQKSTLTDYVTGSDEAVQQYLQKLSSHRVTRTVLVYGLEDKQAYQLHITPWFGEHGQAHGFTVLFNNVNELMSQNTELQQQKQLLNHRILELTQLKSTLNNQLRTPLNALISTLDLIDRQSLDIKQQDIFNTLSQSSYSMLMMLNDMMDLTKVANSNLEITYEPIDIFKLSQHVSSLMVGNAGRQNIEPLHFFMPDCPRYIHTDYKHLCQILLNLFENAVKYTFSGYVALIVESISYKDMQPIIENSWIKTHRHKEELYSKLTAQPSTLSIKTLPIYRQLDSMSTQQSWLRFSIQDSGIGINTDVQREISNYFIQANPQVSSQSGSMGLGLAISSSFGQLLGGFIQLTSEKGVGSTFNLYLPAYKPNYQPIYHSHNSFNHIHLIAIVNQTVSATYLQRLCQYLNIHANIYSKFDKTVIQRLTTELEQKTAVLLLDYEYYLSNTTAAADTTEKETNTFANNTINLETTVSTDIQAFINSTPLPKILLSMKPERSLPSTLLDDFDGFLSKPLDIARLLSELIRLTLPKPSLLLTSVTAEQNQEADNDNIMLQPEEIARPLRTSIALDNLEKSGDVENKEISTEPPLILVVEDNLTNQKITCKLLSKLGYGSEVVADGQQALDKLTAQPQAFALILMDCRMPIMDGWQATQAIRQQGCIVPIIALTANNSEEDQEACLIAGMNEFLTKPVNKDKLKDVLQRFIKS